MNALTLHQPWASFIAAGHKRHETRDWQTQYRGLLAIHAGKRWNGDLQAITQRLISSFRVELGDFVWKEPPLGAVLCICRLVHCYPTETIRDDLDDLERALGDYTSGRYAWEMQLLEVFDPPVPANGEQGLWDWQPPKGFFDNRVAVVGSRSFPDLNTVREYVGTLPPDTIVVSGGAKGVDQAAEEAARYCKLKVISIPVLDHEWKLHPNAAGNIRNNAIVGMAGRMVAFHHSGSSGTADSIAKAKQAGLPVEVNPHLPSHSSVDESKQNERQPAQAVLPIAQDFARTLEPACEQLFIAGSLRRGKADVKDVELVAVPRFFDGQNALLWPLDRLLDEGTIEKAVYGEKKTTRWGEKYRGLMYRGVKIEIFCSLPGAMGYQYWLRTGPGDANTYFMKVCKFKAAPFHVKDGQVWWNDTALEAPDEETWFKLLGILVVAPNQRSVAAYTQLFEKQPHQWGNPKDFVPQAKQLSLGGGFAMHNEAALIDALSKNKKLDAGASAPRPPFVWMEPWLTKDGRVWVYDGWHNGKRKYALVKMNSERARAQERVMGCLYSSETLALREWLETQKGEVPMPNYLPEWDKEDALPRYYVHNQYNDPLEKRFVALVDIQPTQATINYAAAMQYYRSLKSVDEKGNLPLAIQFQDTKVLLVNGHHRYAAQWWLGREAMYVMVDVIPMTLAQAQGEIADDGFDQLAVFADVLEEAYKILQESKEEKELVYG